MSLNRKITLIKVVPAKGSRSGEEGKPRQVWNIHWQQIRTLQAGCQQNALYSHGMSPQRENSVKFGQLFWKPQKSIWMLCRFPHLFLLNWEQEAADGHQSYELWGLRALSWPLGHLWEGSDSHGPEFSHCLLSLVPSLPTQGAHAALLLSGICLVGGGEGVSS